MQHLLQFLSFLVCAVVFSAGRQLCPVCDSKQDCDRDRCPPDAKCYKVLHKNAKINLQELLFQGCYKSVQKCADAVKVKLYECKMAAMDAKCRRCKNYGNCSNYVDHKMACPKDTHCMQIKSVHSKHVNYEDCFGSVEECHHQLEEMFPCKVHNLSTCPTCKNTTDCRSKFSTCLGSQDCIMSVQMKRNVSVLHRVGCYHNLGDCTNESSAMGLVCRRYYPSQVKFRANPAQGNGTENQNNQSNAGDAKNEKIQPNLGGAKQSNVGNQSINVGPMLIGGEKSASGIGVSDNKAENAKAAQNPNTNAQKGADNTDNKSSGGNNAGKKTKDSLPIDDYEDEEEEEYVEANSGDDDDSDILLQRQFDDATVVHRELSKMSPHTVDMALQQMKVTAYVPPNGAPNTCFGILLLYVVVVLEFL